MSSPKTPLPATILFGKLFCNDGQLWVFDRKKTNNIEIKHRIILRTNPFTTPVEDKKGNKNTDIELFLSRIEGQAQPIISKINASEQISNKKKISFLYLLHYIDESCT